MSQRLKRPKTEEKKQAVNRTGSILLFLAFALLIIGLFEMVVLGPQSGYWAIMLALTLFFWYMARKKQS